MEAIEAIMTRRSIRKYLHKPVPEDTIETLLKAAMSAPTARNLQPWHFIIIDDRRLLNDIPSFHPASGMLTEASLAILVCGDQRKDTEESSLVLGCAAATQTILIAARALGLGTVWLGIYGRPPRSAGIIRLLNLPDHIMPISLIAIGYPAEEPPSTGRYDEHKVSRNRWGRSPGENPGFSHME